MSGICLTNCRVLNQLQQYERARDVAAKSREDAARREFWPVLVEWIQAQIGMGRRALAMIDGLSLEAGLEYAQRVLPQMARTQDAREGFRAFNEKRSPVWTGR